MEIHEISAPELFSGSSYTQSDADSQRRAVLGTKGRLGTEVPGQVRV